MLVLQSGHDDSWRPFFLYERGDVNGNHGDNRKRRTQSGDFDSDNMFSNKESWN